jgi:hypothetical protein
MNRRVFGIASFLCLFALIFNFQPVKAHESVTVGSYIIEYGWINEPPIVGSQNAIIVIVSTTGDEVPVEDLSSLTVTISYGGEDKVLALQPLSEDSPGQFIAPIVPTIPGQYALRFGGNLDDTAVNVEVEPEEVESADKLEFPRNTSAQESTDLGMINSLVYPSLLIALIALALAALAFRKAR